MMITVVNSSRGYNYCKLHEPSIRAPKYFKQTLSCQKGETDSNMITLRDFNTPLSTMIDHHDRKWIGNIRLELYFIPKISKRHIQNIAPNSRKIHLLLKWIQNIFQDRSFLMSEEKP